MLKASATESTICGASACAPALTESPRAWIAALQSLDATGLRLALADFAHLLLPLLLRRPVFAQAVLENMISVQGDSSRTQALCDALGLTERSDSLQNLLPLPTTQFRTFASAIGAPPRLAGLTQAEMLVDQVGDQFGNLARSSRPGVGLAALAAAEQHWCVAFDAVWQLASRKPAAVATSALACFAPDRRDADAAALAMAMLSALPTGPAIGRAVTFGTTQADIVLRGLFDALASRASQLND
jgi:hypothetical protein